MADPDAHVRRSSANHLNDVSKDHPRVALDLARRWRSRGEDAAWVVRHGLRTLVKRGDPRALELLGAAPGAAIRLTALTADPSTVPIGEAVTFSLTVELAGDGGSGRHARSTGTVCAGSWRRGAQLVEVLPASEYAEDHLPGAINLPLRRLEQHAKTVLDPDQPVVAYCWDSA